jgi:hypothetical protein
VAIHAGHQPLEVSNRRSRAAVRRLADSKLVAELGERERILELQRKAGNRAVVAALMAASAGPARGVIQRISWDDVMEVLSSSPVGLGARALRRATGVDLGAFNLAEQAVRASASRISIPSSYFVTAGRYMAANAADGAVIRDAINQGPKHYQGGWLLDVQGDAAAITFGNSIFYDQSPPSEATFMHEMVHIHQYNRLGRAAFLASYFGISLATIIKRAIAGQPIEAMKSSPHERDAYALEERFERWRAANP